MANAGPNTNSFQFHLHLHLHKTKWLDSKHVVFHQVKEGTDESHGTVRAMEHYGSRHGRTSQKITIADHGQLS